MLHKVRTRPDTINDKENVAETAELMQLSIDVEENIANSLTECVNTWSAPIPHSGNSAAKTINSSVLLGSLLTRNMVTFELAVGAFKKGQNVNKSKLASTNLVPYLGTV
jgi:hypothetical protein